MIFADVASIREVVAEIYGDDSGFPEVDIVNQLSDAEIAFALLNMIDDGVSAIELSNEHGTIDTPERIGALPEKYAQDHQDCVGDGEVP